METNFLTRQIALDPMDLNFLPLSFKRSYSKTAPLWSMSEWDKKEEYFEFEVRNKSEDKISNDMPSIFNEITTCYICDIEVPKLFIKEHLTSKKHLIFKQIANTAMERIKNHLNNFDENVIESDPNLYFCPECVTIVKITDKTSHNRLQSHKNSLMTDKILNDFLYLYLNKNNDEAINEREWSKCLHDESLFSDGNEKLNNDSQLLNDNSRDFNEIPINKENKLSNSLEGNDSQSDRMSLNNTVTDTDITKKEQKQRKSNLKKSTIQSNDIFNVIIDTLHTSSEKKSSNDLEFNNNETSHDLQSNDNIQPSNDLNLKNKEIKTFFVTNTEKDAETNNDFQSNDKMHSDNDLESIDKEEFSAYAQSNAIISNVLPFEYKEVQERIIKGIVGKLCDYLPLKDMNESSNHSQCINDISLKSDDGSKTKDSNKIKKNDVMNGLKVSVDSIKIAHIDGKRIFEKHNEQLKASINSHKICIINEDYLEIETLDGAKLCVPSANYFGSSLTAEPNETFCEICRCAVDSDKLDQHLNGETHMEAMLKSLNDKNCLRPVYQKEYHCVLCNKINDDPESHRNTKYHQKQLRTALVKKGVKLNSELHKYEHREIIYYGTKVNENMKQEVDSETQELLDSLKYVKEGLGDIVNNEQLQSIEAREMLAYVESKVFLCRACEIDVHLNDVKSHIAGARHKMNKISDAHYMIKEEGDQLVCKICEKNMPNNPTSLSEHINSSSHVDFYINTMYENWIDDRFHSTYLLCTACDERMLDKQFLVHIHSKKHIKLMKEYELEIKEDKSKLPYFCPVCEVYIPNTDDTIKAHDYNVHRKEAELNTVKNNSSANKSFITKSSNADSSNVVNQNTESDTPSSNSVKLDKNNVNKEKVTRYYCWVCEVEIPNHSNNILTHNDGAAHKKNLKKKDKPSTSNVTNDKPIKNDYYCVYCRVDVTNHPKNIQEHKDGASHKRNFEAFQTEIQKGMLGCKVCKMNIPNSEKFITEHRNSLLHMEKYENALIADKIYKQDERYYCVPCHGLVDGPLTHMKSASHLQKLKSLDNKLKHMDGRFSRLDKDLSDYVALQQSQAIISVTDVPFLKQTSNEKEVFCDICSTLVPNREYNISTHLSGMRHKNNCTKFNKIVLEWKILRDKMKQPNVIVDALNKFTMLLENELK